MRILRMAIALVVVSGVSLFSQSEIGTGPGLPDPFGPPELMWAKLPDGRAWGSTAGVEIGPHNEVWAIERCSGTRCDDSDLPAVQLLDLKTGKAIRGIGGGLFAYPHGLHVDRDGNIWVSDAAATKDGKRGHQVIKFSPEGKILMKLGEAGVPGGGPTHFNEPCDAITNRNGEIFVADGHGGASAKDPAYVTRIVVFSKDGKWLREWGKLGTGPGEFRNPHALAFDSRGRLFVADRFNSRLQIFDQTGKFIAEWTQFGMPSGLYIDRNDTMYVIDADSNEKNHPGWTRGIRIGSARDGKVTAFVPPTVNEKYPDGMAGEGVLVGPDGNLYAAENVLRGITRYLKKP